MERVGPKIRQEPFEVLEPPDKHLCQRSVWIQVTEIPPMQHRPHEVYPAEGEIEALPEGHRTTCTRWDITS